MFDDPDNSQSSLIEQENIERRVPVRIDAKHKTFLAIKDVAKILGYSNETVRGLVANGLITYMQRKSGCLIRIPYTAVEEYLEKYIWPAPKNQPESSQLKIENSSTSQMDGNAIAQRLRIGRMQNAS